jgi:TIR domain
MMKIEQKKIFLSHASKDKPLADKLVDLLTLGCAVDPNDILCTSLEGKGIPAGTSSFIQFLRAQIQKPDLVILLLSENFFASQFCVCELGAVWGMDLSYFPIVVPPLDKTKLKAVLAVAQAGDILNTTWLDELRDGVKEKVNVSVRTATWTVKRDEFLKTAEKTIASLPQPSLVPVEKLKEAEERYQVALADVQSKGEEIDLLKAHIDELEKCKDATQVKAITRKYSTAEEEFTRLRKQAQRSLTKLERATCLAIFWEFRGHDYAPSGDNEWEDVKVADSQDQIEVDEDNSMVTPNDDHPLVREAKSSLYTIEKFLHAEEQLKFIEALEKEHKFVIRLGNKDFWSEFLVKV